METTHTSRASFCNKTARSVLAALLLAPACPARAGETVRDQKLFYRAEGPRVGVFGRRQIVPLDAAGKHGATLTLDEDVTEGALSADGNRLALAGMSGGLYIVNLDLLSAKKVVAKEFCANLGWNAEGALLFTTSSFVPGGKEAVLTVMLHRLEAGSDKPALVSKFLTPLPPPPAPPPMPVLPGVPPAAPPPPAPKKKTP